MEDFAYKVRDKVNYHIAKHPGYMAFGSLAAGVLFALLITFLLIQ